MLRGCVERMLWHTQGCVVRAAALQGCFCRQADYQIGRLSDFYQIIS